MLTYEQAKIKRRSLKNPWLTQELDRMASSCERGTFQMEFICIVDTYFSSQSYSAVALDCGKCLAQRTSWVKHTIGGRKCTVCGALTHTNGEPLRAA